MDAGEKGQVVSSAAEVYEEFFLPSLFQQWAAPMLAAAGIQPGDRVLDVACGTGVVARAAVERVGPGGRVVGVDINEGMLAVARRKGPAVEWRPGRAEDLPLESSSFDAVTCQFGLMFFEDRTAALQEMMRVLRPRGRLAVAVWDSIGASPGYAALADLLRELFGEPAAAALQAPFVLGDVHALRSLFAQAGMPEVQIMTRPGFAHFPSLEKWMYTDIKGWTLADQLDDGQYANLLKEADTVLRPFVTANGSVKFSSPAHIATFSKA